MGSIFRNRQVAGNICLVVFLAFMFTLLPGQLWTDKAYAAEETAALTTVTINHSAVVDKETVTIDPVSDVTFANTIQVLINEINNTVNNLVYKVTYDKVNSVVYSVYLWYYGVTSGTIKDLTYTWVYDNVYGKQISVPVKVWKPKRSSGSSTTATIVLTDLKDSLGKPHWATDYINALVSKGIIDGYQDGTFRPEVAVTRAEFAKMIAIALKLDTKLTTAKYADVKNDEWFAGFIAAATDAKIVNGYGSAFKPNQSISREEMAVMTSRALDYLKKYNALSAQQVANLIGKFKDGKKVGTWSDDAVAFLINEQLLLGRTPQTIVPEGIATRAEAATFLYRMLKKNNEI